MALRIVSPPPGELPLGFEDVTAPAAGQAPQAGAGALPSGFEDVQAPPFPVTQGDMQGPPPPPPTESGFWSTLGHGAYGALKGPIAGTLGFPQVLLGDITFGKEYDPEKPYYKRKPRTWSLLPSAPTIEKGIDWLAGKTGLYTPPVPVPLPPAPVRLPAQR